MAAAAVAAAAAAERREQPVFQRTAKGEMTGSSSRDEDEGCEELKAWDAGKVLGSGQGFQLLWSWTGC